MGIKYASIHISLNGFEVTGITDKIKLFAGMIAPYKSSKQHLREYIETKKYRNYKIPTERELDWEKRFYFEHGRFAINIIAWQDKLSIYSGSFGFENIVGYAGLISKYIDLPIFYISNFDDDIFIFGLVQNNSELAYVNCTNPINEKDMEDWLVEFNQEGHTKQDYYEEINYGIKASEYNQDIIWKYLDVAEPMFEAKEDPLKAQRFIKKALKVPLFLDDSGPEAFPEKYEEIGHGEGYRLYKLLKR